MFEKIVVPALAFLLYSLSGTAQVKRMSSLQLQKRLNDTDTVYVVNFWQPSVRLA
ncbi:hypothetical protein [Mucilaginibacter sp. CSA2-8R]|uniref:hypothetical protein n=1 Tax=Mucilaginibacter sp. CSA2-8R TaxID=3141542 RepID=UPI00315DE455